MAGALRGVLALAGFATSSCHGCVSGLASVELSPLPLAWRQVCLFGANEVSLRDAMREGAGDEDLRAIISAAVSRKRAAHAGMFELARTKNRAMIRIGG